MLLLSYQYVTRNLLQDILLLNTVLQQIITLPKGYQANEWKCLFCCCMHVLSWLCFETILRSSLFLEFSLDHVLEFHSIHSKLSDTLCQFICCHCIFIQKPAELFLIQRHFFDVEFFRCKDNMQNDFVNLCRKLLTQYIGLTDLQNTKNIKYRKTVFTNNRQLLLIIYLYWILMSHQSGQVNAILAPFLSLKLFFPLP